MPDWIIGKFSELAMNERQAKVYLAILKNNNSTTSEIHRLSRVQLNKTYEILKFLNSTG